MINTNNCLEKSNSFDNIESLHDLEQSSNEIDESKCTDLIDQSQLVHLSPLDQTLTTMTNELGLSLINNKPKLSSCLELNFENDYLSSDRDLNVFKNNFSSTSLFEPNLKHSNSTLSFEESLVSCKPRPPLVPSRSNVSGLCL